MLRNLYFSVFLTLSGELLRHPGGAAGDPHEAGDAEGAAGLRQVERRRNRRTESAGRRANTIKSMVEAVGKIKQYGGEAFIKIFSRNQWAYS